MSSLTRESLQTYIKFVVFSVNATTRNYIIMKMKSLDESIPAENMMKREDT